MRLHVPLLADDHELAAGIHLLPVDVIRSEYVDVETAGHRSAFTRPKVPTQVSRSGLEVARLPDELLQELAAHRVDPERSTARKPGEQETRISASSATDFIEGGLHHERVRHDADLVQVRPRERRRTALSFDAQRNFALVGEGTGVIDHQLPPILIG